MNHVQSWAENRQEVLRGCMGRDVKAQDFTDDRLEIVLDALSDDGCWAEFETALNRRTVRVYDLKAQRVRATTVSGYWTVTRDGLFQLGHSKDHRPDLPQLKVMQSALDPLGMPVATLVVALQKNSFRCRLRKSARLPKSRGKNLSGYLYGTNQPVEQLSLEQAVLAYREEYLVERGFGRLKGKPLSLTPMYLQDDRRATGLIRLLTIGLRVLTLLEFDVRHRLTEQNEKLAGLYAGNPKRTTARPTAESLLAAFDEIHLTIVTSGQQVQRHITPLSELQQKILTLLDFPSNLYTGLAADSQIPP